MQIFLKNAPAPPSTGSGNAGGGKDKIADANVLNTKSKRCNYKVPIGECHEVKRF